MNEPIVILDSRGFHVRAGGTWHHGLSREQSRRALLDAGIDTHDTCLLLESPVWWPDPVEVEYRPTGRRHWLVDGVPVTKEGAAWIFRRVGLTHDETRHLMRIHQLAYEIEQRLPPPPTDSMTVAEFCHLLAAELAHALSIRVAGQWVCEHLRPARRKHPLGLAGWKERFEQDKPKRRITQEEFAQVLADAKIKVIGDAVYAAKIRS